MVEERGKAGREDVINILSGTESVATSRERHPGDSIDDFPVRSPEESFLSVQSYTYTAMLCAA